MYIQESRRVVEDSDDEDVVEYVVRFFFIICAHANAIRTKPPTKAAKKKTYANIYKIQ